MSARVRSLCDETVKKFGTYHRKTGWRTLPHHRPKKSDSPLSQPSSATATSIAVATYEFLFRECPNISTRHGEEVPPADANMRSSALTYDGPLCSRPGCDSTPDIAKRFEKRCAPQFPTTLELLCMPSEPALADSHLRCHLRKLPAAGTCASTTSAHVPLRTLLTNKNPPEGLSDALTIGSSTSALLRCTNSSMIPSNGDRAWSPMVIVAAN